MIKNLQATNWIGMKLELLAKLLFPNNCDREFIIYTDKLLN